MALQGCVGEVFATFGWMRKGCLVMRNYNELVG